MASGASQAARWQAYQTRARMGAQLWFRIISSVIFAWAAVTTYVVWWATGGFFPHLDHQYFWRWVCCGTLLDIPLLNLFASRLKVPAAGQWYPLIEFTDWLNGPQLYHLPFPAWFLHYGVRTALLPLGGAGIALVWRFRHQFDEEHLRGLRLLAPRLHNRQLRAGLFPVSTCETESVG